MFGKKESVEGILSVFSSLLGRLKKLKEKNEERVYSNEVLIDDLHRENGTVKEENNKIDKAVTGIETITGQKGN